jgi:hypothetical protein
MEFGSVAMNILWTLPMRTFLPFFKPFWGKRDLGTPTGKSNFFVVVLKTALPSPSRRTRTDIFPAMLCRKHSLHSGR